MMSMENNMHRMLPNNEDTRRLLYMSSLHRPSISGNPHRTQPDLSTNHLSHPNRPQASVKRLGYQQATIQPTTTNAVSRRNARERKRVRLVNLGFSTLRERVPSGTKNKKLSKVETLRAAIEYIRQLQDVLGMPDQQTSYEDLERMMADENYGRDDCSSVASSEEVRGPSGGSGDLSPASSHPSECSLVASPYTNQHSHDDQLMDIGLWFS